MIARLVVALLALAPLLDGSAAHGPIPRLEPVVRAIATVSAETEAPATWAARLDVWAAYETAYGAGLGADVAGGCPGVRVGTPCARDRGAIYCGPWMTECRRVPRGATLEDEARIAITMFRESFATCPAHPYAIYSTGRCVSSGLVDFRLFHVRRELAALEGAL